MKNNPSVVGPGDILSGDTQDEQDTGHEKGRPVFDTDTSASDLEFRVLIGNYMGQIKEQVENETTRIICLPGVLEIGIETGFNFEDSSKIYEKILEQMEDVILGTTFALNDEGVIFKDMPASQVDN